MSKPIEPFDDTARYERFMGRWSRCLAPAFIAFCDIGRAHRVLDVGCGTGAMCDALDATFPACHVTGVDLSLEFVRHCRARLPLARFSFDRANAAELPYQDARFDAALSLLLLMLVPDQAGVAAELQRVTRPGGVVAACTWDATGLSMVDAFWHEALVLDPQAPSGAGRTVCARPGQLAALWHSTGLADVTESVVTITMEFHSFDDFWLPLAACRLPLASGRPGPISAACRLSNAWRFAIACVDGSMAWHNRAAPWHSRRPH